MKKYRNGWYFVGCGKKAHWFGDRYASTYSACVIAPRGAPAPEDSAKCKTCLEALKKMRETYDNGI